MEEYLKLKNLNFITHLEEVKMNPRVAQNLEDTNCINLKEDDGFCFLYSKHCPYVSKVKGIYDLDHKSAERKCDGYSLVEEN